MKSIAYKYTVLYMQHHNTVLSILYHPSDKLKVFLARGWPYREPMNALFW
jgi:hypothetical protein